MILTCPSCTNEIKIKKEDLKGKITCPRCGWVITGRGEKLKKLTQEEADEVCKLHALHLCRAEGGVPADFSNCDLTGIDFSGKDLRRADFHGSNVSGANFTDAILRSADFRGTNSSGIVLNGASTNDVKLGPINGIS